MCTNDGISWSYKENKSLKFNCGFTDLEMNSLVILYLVPRKPVLIERRFSLHLKISLLPSSMTSTEKYPWFSKPPSILAKHGLTRYQSLIFNLKTCFNRKSEFYEWMNLIITRSPSAGRMRMSSKSWWFKNSGLWYIEIKVWFINGNRSFLFR